MIVSPPPTSPGIIANLVILIMAPDPGTKSFRDILRANSGFFVPPLQWTSRHLDLVGCRFEDVAPPIYTEPPPNNGTSQSQKRSSKQANVAEVLATNPFPLIKRQRLINILVDKEGRFAGPRRGAGFYFEGRLVHQPEYITFHPLEQPINHIHYTLPPMVGYVHYTSVNGARRRQFEPCPGPKGSFNYIGERICRKRVDQTTPKEWTEDPYFVCHLLALAQLQERKLKLSDPVTYTSRLLVTNALDREYMLFYEAKITTELLNGLRDPKTATTPLVWPAVRRKKLPYKPYDTFADRLVAELAVPSPLFSDNLLPSGKPSPPDSSLTPRDTVNHVIETGQKRPHERKGSRSHKIRRTSKETSKHFINRPSAGNLSAC